MKWITSLLFLLLLTASNSLFAQSKDVTEEQWRLINKALIDGERAAEDVRDLTEKVNLTEQQLIASGEIRKAEHRILLETKRSYLSALVALREYRTKRRPLVVKILTVGIVRDKHDKKLEADITALEKEIEEWKP